MNDEGSAANQVSGSGSHLQFLLNGLDKVDDYYCLLTRVAQCHWSEASTGLNPNLLLLDSCLTVNLISNCEMLGHVHWVHPLLRVQCNDGIKLLSLMASFGDFSEPDWFDPEGVANILSLHTASKYYAVTYDSRLDNVFHIHNKQG